MVFMILAAMQSAEAVTHSPGVLQTYGPAVSTTLVGGWIGWQILGSFLAKRKIKATVELGENGDTRKPGDGVCPLHESLVGDIAEIKKDLRMLVEHLLGSKRD